MTALAAACFACFVVGCWLAVPIARKPLSEDDGRWYYPALFRSHGLVPGRDFVACGYFNVQWFASKAFDLCGGRDAGFFPRMKVVWYGLNAASACLAGSALFGGIVPGLAAGLLLALVQAVPNTLFMLTYAEHYAILPANLALACILWGAGGGSLLLVAAGGVFAGLVVQFKPTGVVYAAALSLVVFTCSAWALPLGVYLAGCIAVQTAPLFFLSRKAGSCRHYLSETFYAPFGDGIAALCSLLGVNRPDRQMSQYVRTRHEDVSMGDWEKLRVNVGRAVHDLRGVLALGVAGGLGAVASGYALPALIAVGVMLVHVLVQQLQKNYYTPHFNPVWQGVTLLGGAAVAGIVQVVGINPIIGLAAVGGVGWLFVPAVAAVAREHRTGSETAFGILHPYVGVLFDTAAQIGGFIEERTNPDDRLCVWGDQPSIYLYARRMAFSHHHLFLYSHHGKLNHDVWVLRALRENPPACIVFCNWRYPDQWNAQSLGQTMGVGYVQEAVFTPQDASGTPIAGPHGKVEFFPLYRRDDASCIRAFFERAACAPRVEAKSLLRTILKMDPDNKEAQLRLRILESERAGPRAEMKLASSAMHGNGKASAMFVLGQALLDCGEAARAIDTLTEAEAFAPDNPRLKAALAGAWLAQGQKKGRAVRLVQQALDIDPHCADARYLLAEFMAMDGNVQGSVSQLRRVLIQCWRHKRAAALLDKLSGSVVERVRIYDEAGVFGYHTPEELAPGEFDPELFTRLAHEHRRNV